MGNIDPNICNSQNSLDSPNQKIPNIQQIILKNRKQLQTLPSVPISIKQTINNLIGQPNLQTLSKSSKIWEITSPCKFAYFNQPQVQDMMPCGLCSIYLYNQNKVFTAFFRGYVNSQGMRETKNSIYVFHNGDYFIGDKQRQNYGIFTDKQNKYKYEGDWINNKPHGIGKQTTNKGIYEGYFLEGKKHGLGKYYFINGFTYAGQFKNNEIQGNGKLQNEKQNYQYTGQFKAGLKHGKGIQITKQFHYEGYFVKNVKKGVGKIAYIKQNIVYQGQFQGNIPHGKGKLIQTSAETKTTQGIFNFGQLVIIHPYTP